VRKQIIGVDLSNGEDFTVVQWVMWRALVFKDSDISRKNSTP